MSLIDLANPSRFLALTDRVLPWLSAATLLAFAFGVSQAYLAPDDYQQGATVKIMFIHVPAAWLGLFAWMLMSAAALGTLVWRHPLADVAAKAAAPIGAAITPRYIRNRTSTEVSRASQTQYVPHIGRPHKEPVTRHISVNAAPIGAAALAATSASGCRHTSVPSAAALINIQAKRPSHAAGT